MSGSRRRNRLAPSIAFSPTQPTISELQRSIGEPCLDPGHDLGHGPGPDPPHSLSFFIHDPNRDHDPHSIQRLDPCPPHSDSAGVTLYH